MNNGLHGPNPTETVTGGKTLELSKYDKIRRPHKLIADDTKIKVTSRTLSTELCCPICLDLLTCTMTTKECLHRFCSECITTALMRGNKECPTCRKKIVSKRSLRPDPNFDFLISKIWPDRKQYDAEFSVSMMLFQEQSNVVSLQRSIEEGIRAQAAYRKQRVQGSYDYEKRQRRPKAAIFDANNVELASNSVEQVTVSLTPAVFFESGGHESPLESIESSVDSDSSNDSNCGDSSSITSASSEVSTSSFVSNSTTVNKASSRQSTVQSVEEQHPKGEIDFNRITLEDMVGELRKRGGDIEVELTPSKFLLHLDSVPSILKTSHFIRTSIETTFAAIGEFLFQISNKASGILTANSEQLSNGSSAPLSSSSLYHSTSNINLKIRAELFLFVDRWHQLCKIDPSECLATIFCNSIQWDRHLMIFFDLQSSDDNCEEFELSAVIGEELAKSVAVYATVTLKIKEESQDCQNNLEVMDVPAAFCAQTQEEVSFLSTGRKPKEPGLELEA